MHRRMGINGTMTEALGVMGTDERVRQVVYQQRIIDHSERAALCHSFASHTDQGAIVGHSSSFGNTV